MLGNNMTLDIIRAIVAIHGVLSGSIFEEPQKKKNSTKTSV